MPGRFVQRGGGWVLGQNVLLLVVGALGWWFRGATARPVVTGAGAALLVVSAVCGVAGTVALGRNLTPFPRPSSQTRLVRHGIYRRMRHPLYTAVVSAALGWALVRASWPAGLAALLLALWLDAKARREERWLRERFPDYAAYAARVRRFVPGIY
jgi:protein-S-isoprenylcysteine O-methyltransferase Ste14